MNPGMLSTIIVVCIGILVLSGWNRILFEPYSPYVVLSALLVWMTGAGRMVSSGEVSIDLAWLLWSCTALLALIDALHRKNDISGRVMLLGHLFLASSIWFFMEMQHSLGYGSALAIPLWISAVILGVFIGLIYHTVQLQWAIITLSIALGEVFASMAVHAGTALHLGSLTTFDCWWTAFAVSRLSVVFHRYVLGRVTPNTD